MFPKKPCKQTEHCLNFKIVGKSELLSSYRELLTMMKEAAKCRQFQVYTIHIRFKKSYILFKYIISNLKGAGGRGV